MEEWPASWGLVIVNKSVDHRFRTLRELDAVIKPRTS